MNFRIRLARFLLRLGSFLQSLPVVVMKPDDLVAFSQGSYAKPADVESWSEDGLVDAGLDSEELELLRSVPLTEGNLLLLGMGGGREAIPFAKMGFDVTGVDYVPAMVQRAIENAERQGVKIKGLVQEISQLDVPSSYFDLVWIPKAMYSTVPTRARRVKMVQRIAQSLKPGGVFLCQFHSSLAWQPSAKEEKLRRLIAKFPFGNKAYEEGDLLWMNVEFLHVFTSKKQIQSELEEGGFHIKQIKMESTSSRGQAVCVKN